MIIFYRAALINYNYLQLKYQFTNQLDFESYHCILYKCLNYQNLKRRAEKLNILKYLIALVLFLTVSCSLQINDQGEGVIWQKDLSYPPVAGIELHGANMFFADESGALYSCWIDTGFINWKRQLFGEEIRMIFVTGSGLGVISQKAGSMASVYRIFTFEQGISVFETNLTQNIRDSYNSNDGFILVHSPSRVVRISGDGRTVKTWDLSRYTGNIVTFAYWGLNYYAIDGNSRILRFDPSLRLTGTFTGFKGAFGGDANYYDGKIYMTSTSVKILNTVSWMPETAQIESPGSPENILFDGKASGLLKKAGPGEKYLLFSNMSFLTPPGGGSYSPIVHSDSLGVAAFIDSKGFLNVVDSRTGYFVYSKFIGMMERPFLKVSRDYNSKSVFIPLSSPAKIFCYSLNFAASRKMPR